HSRLLLRAKADSRSICEDTPSRVCEELVGIKRPRSLGPKKRRLREDADECRESTEPTRRVRTELQVGMAEDRRELPSHIPVPIQPYLDGYGSTVHKSGDQSPAIIS